MDLCVPNDPKSIKRECMILLEKVTVAYQSLCIKKMKVLISDDEEMVYTKKTQLLFDSMIFKIL